MPWKECSVMDERLRSKTAGGSATAGLAANPVERSW